MPIGTTKNRKKHTAKDVVVILQNRFTTTKRNKTNYKRKEEKS
jgi:hypothetical protein